MHGGEVGCRMRCFVCAFGILSPLTVTERLVAQGSMAKAEVMGERLGH